MSEGNLTILVVDDEEVICDLLHSFLTRTGYNSIVASNGKDAIDSIRRNNPDVVLLDIKMPEMDGHQTCRRLRDVTSFSKPMGIIMITGYGSRDNKERAVESGADDLMEKPLDLYEVHHRIKSWVEVREINEPMVRVSTYAFLIRQYNRKPE